MLQNKIIQVYVIGDANAFYLDLKQKAEQELLQNKTGTFLQTLFESIETKKEELKKDPFYGIQIPKKLIPKNTLSNITSGTFGNAILHSPGGQFILSEARKLE